MHVAVPPFQGIFRYTTRSKSKKETRHPLSEAVTVIGG
jgi:hypothetical protein